LQCPERVKGYLFEYELQSTSRNVAVMKFTERVYKVGAATFETFKEKDETEFMDYPTGDLKKSNEIWHKALGYTNKLANDEKARLREAARGMVQPPSATTEFDFSDIDTLYERRGKGPHLLELDFVQVDAECTPYINRNEEQSSWWMWAHRLTGQKCKRFVNDGGKSYDTGKLVKYMKRIKQHQHPLAFARAKRIMFLNKVDNPVPAEETEVACLPMNRIDLIRQQVSQLLCLLPPTQTCY
jgi:hypothetical protein